MTDTLVCPQPGCQLGVSGRCLEGFDPPETCPHQQELHNDYDESVAYVEQDLITLPSGEALTDAQAAAVAASGPTKLIVIAGPYSSGKTTILTALFEAFQEAPFGNYTFRGSRTLVGFEKRCHLGRKESGQETAETSHTSVREGVVFLHLDLAFRDHQSATNENILLSDISGELFRQLRDVGETVDQIKSLKRADHLCIVIDGEKIVGRESRQVARNDSRSILRSIIEADVISSKCAIDLAISKWDLVVEALQSEGGDSLASFLEETIKVVRDVAPHRQFRLFEVAARPPVEARVPFAHGLPTLLRAWMDHDEVSGGGRPLFYPAHEGRQFNRYTAAVLARESLGERYNATQI